MDKPAGPTSHDVVAMVRRAWRIRRVGHAGTLDPFATGLLLVLIGPATRLARYLVGLPKEYRGVIRLGARTATDDPTGAVVATSDRWEELDDETIRQAMAALTGERLQTPPAYSAKQVGGQRAHRLARQGRPVRLVPTLVRIERFELLERRGPDVAFLATVGSGTYLRALARELGEQLGCGAHLARLTRTAVGPFRLEQAGSLEALQAGQLALLPPEQAVGHLAAVSIGPEDHPRILQGQAIRATGPGAGPVALLCQGRLVAVARRRDGWWQPEVVLPA